MYAEVLDLIASFEAGLAYEIEKASKEAGRKLLPHEVDTILKFSLLILLSFLILKKQELKWPLAIFIFGMLSIIVGTIYTVSES